MLSTVSLTICVGSATLDSIVCAELPNRANSRVVAENGIVAGGGPAATAAVALARLGIETAFVGCVGDDEAGAMIRAGLVRERVDVRFLKTVPGRASSLSAILVDPISADRSIAVYPGTIGPVEIDPDTMDRFAQAGWVHVDHLGWAVVPKLRAAGILCPVSVDGGNPISDLDLALADVYVPARAELERLSGCTDPHEGLAWALNQGIPLAVVTLGADGAAAAGTFDLDRGGEGAILSAPRDGVVRSQLQLEGFATRVFSTLGAGDVFHGALVAGLRGGLAVRQALRLANVVASLSCAGLDGRSAIPRQGDPDVLAAVADPDQLALTNEPETAEVADK